MSPRALLNLIDHLPRNSAFREAIADDEDIARLHLATATDDDASGSGAPAGPPLSEYSPEVAALAHIADRLASLIVATYEVQGRKPPKFQPYPRPVTAIDRVKAELRESIQTSLEAQLFGS